MPPADAADGLTVRLPAEAAALGALRDRLRSWLHEHGVTAALAEDVVLAVHEAAANSAEHAYGAGGAGTAAVDVRCAFDGPELACTVTDTGRWQTPGDPGDRGRGLVLMRTLVDDLRVDADAAGTTVELLWRTAR